MRCSSLRMRLPPIQLPGRHTQHRALPGLTLLFLLSLGVRGDARETDLPKISFCEAGEGTAGNVRAKDFLRPTKNVDRATAIDSLRRQLAATADDCAEKGDALLQLSTLLLDEGALQEAKRAARQALSIFRQRKPESDFFGSAQYLLAVISDLESHYPEAERQYQESIQTFRSLSPPRHDLVSRIYSDLAVLAIQMSDRRKAEQHLRESEAAEKHCTTIVRREQAVRVDAMGHIKLSLGHQMEAKHHFAQMVADYGTDQALDPSLRGHFYQDYGVLALEMGELGEASASLHKSLDLQQGRDLNRVPVATIRAHLARIAMAQQDNTQAETMLQEASDTIAPVASEFPSRAAAICYLYGQFLASQGRWREAHAHYLQAIRWEETDPNLKQLENITIRQLIEAARRLKLKQEAKSYKRRLKEVQAVTKDPWTSNTVDLATLRKSLDGNAR
jgi:tetratricopeptide (TPR) repeat protein